jgi:hypothetical protein
MNKIVTLGILFLVIVSMFCGTVAAAEEPVSQGPSEVAGDGIPDGSQYGPGPAPNSHDGIPDGPGW